MTAQILAAVIFVGMFALIIMDKFERQYVTLGSAALVLGICMHSWDAIKNALNLGAFFRTDFWYGASESASSGVNWSTIFFITGMMIMVEGLGKSGFFRWLCLSLAKATHYHVVPLLVLHGHGRVSGHVHRQHHGRAVSGDRHAGAGADPAL